MAELRTGRLVLDASAVVRIIAGSEQSASFQEAVLNADLVLAPELMLTEVANALWRLQRAGQLAADGLQQRLSRAAELVDVIEPDGADDDDFPPLDDGKRPLKVAAFTLA